MKFTYVNSHRAQGVNKKGEESSGYQSDDGKDPALPENL